MSLINLTNAYGCLSVRTRMAEDQCRDFERVLAQWFIDSDPAARNFLRQIAVAYRKGNPVSGTVARNVEGVVTHP